jgi:hypothetical protein
MNHRFVDADMNPICTNCAKRLIPEEVKRAEEFEREFYGEKGRNDDSE